MTQATREKVAELQAKANSLLSAINSSEYQTKLNDLQALTYQPNFWQQAEAKQVMQQISLLENQLSQISAVTTLQTDVAAFLDLIGEEESAEEAELEAELIVNLRRFERALNKLELNQFL